MPRPRIVEIHCGQVLIGFGRHVADGAEHRAVGSPIRGAAPMSIGFTSSPSSMKLFGSEPKLASLRPSL
jgi:hypothetical protein